VPLRRADAALSGWASRRHGATSCRDFLPILIWDAVARSRSDEEEDSAVERCNKHGTHNDQCPQALPTTVVIRREEEPNAEDQHWRQDCPDYESEPREESDGSTSMGVHPAVYTLLRSGRRGLEARFRPLIRMHASRPARLFADGTWYREESKDMAQAIRAGKLRQRGP
jgi:hypothetical protein